MQQNQKHLKSKKILIIYIFRVSKWKQSVDDSVTFYDDGKIPSILVENKSDLLSPEEEQNMQKLKKYSEDLKFNGCFRASAKTGKNISESMEFLIIEIIKRMEEISSKGNELVNDRKSVTLDPDKHNKEIDKKRKEGGGGCCG